MNLDEWQRNWDQLGKDDPLWVVLTDPNKKGGKWDTREFFATGEREIAEVMEHISSLAIKVARNRALDFGCGVGRLSRALTEHFSEVHGIDISPSMIAHAKTFNRDRTSCRFHLNASDRLEIFEDDSFDFIYSNIALQHIEPVYSKQYIQEFLRVLKPGGVAVFQLISASFLRGLFPQWFVDAYRRIRHRGKAFIGMFGLREREVARLVTARGGTVVGVERTSTCWRWISCRFCVVKSTPVPATGSLNTIPVES